MCSTRHRKFIEVQFLFVLTLTSSFLLSLSPPYIALHFHSHSRFFFFGAFTCIWAWVVLWVRLFPQTYSEIIDLGQKNELLYIHYNFWLSWVFHNTLMECHWNLVIYPPQPSTCQNHVSDAFGANCHAICVFEETDHVGFCRLLKGIDGPAAPALAFGSPWHGRLYHVNRKNWVDRRVVIITTL